MFLAQVAHESQGFKKLRENLHYSAARLLAVFPKKFKSLKESQDTVNQGEAAIAEKIYGARKDLGNSTAGDGGRYIGRGYIHLTGRSNYKAAGDDLGLDLVGHPDLAEEPKNAARIAVWFWKRDKRLGERARNRDVSGVTKIVNNGLNGLEDRKKRFKEYIEILKFTTPAPIDEDFTIQAPLL
jgi:putative chitinase